MILTAIVGYLFNEARKALTAAIAGPLVIYLDRAWPIFVATGGLYVPTLQEAFLMVLAGIATGYGVWQIPNRVRG